MAAFYILAGANHFIMPNFYLKIIPPYLPFPKAINISSGILEIVLGVLLLTPMYSIYAAWGIILLLVFVFPANIYHFQISKGKMELLSLIRLPIQLLFVLWAFSHTH